MDKTLIKCKKMWVLALVLVMAAFNVFYFRVDLFAESREGNEIFVETEKTFINSKIQHQKDVASIEQAEEYIREGNALSKEGLYDAAIDLYKKAYDVDPNGGTFIALKLIEIYERVGRYDDALSLLEERSKSKKLSDYSMQELAVIRSRLLAAKAQSSSNQ